MNGKVSGTKHQGIQVEASKGVGCAGKESSQSGRGNPVKRLGWCRARGILQNTHEIQQKEKSAGIILE